jgi:hypothetical protein
MEVKGSIPLGEMAQAGGELAKRQFGWRRYVSCAYLGLLVSGAVIWMNTPGALGFDWGSAFGGLAITAVLMTSGYLWWARRMLAASWKRLGAPPQTTVSYQLDEQTLTVSTGGGVRTVMPWSVVQAIWRSSDAWLIVVGTLAYVVPHRFLADTVAEQSFLAFCLDRLSPEARSRSPDLIAKVQR